MRRRADTTLSALDRALTRFYEKISAWEEGIAESVGLSPRQCHAVTELERSGKIRMKALARQLGISTGTLTVMADRLLKQDLIVREADPSDGRAFFVSLSPKGTEIAREHHKQHEVLYRELDKAMNASETESFLAALERLERIDFSPNGE